MKRTRLAPMSDRRRERITLRQIAMEIVRERDDNTCRALGVWPHRCVGPLDGHEPLTRARGGDPTDPDNIVLVCRLAHDHLHANPEWAHSVGLLVHSWEAP